MMFPIVATTLMGMAVIAVLVADKTVGVAPIIWAAAGGFVAALPVSWLIARQILADAARRKARAAARSSS
ncbi:MAG: hypothetical protein ACXIT4_01640 [Erythrobacter sp.]